MYCSSSAPTRSVTTRLKLRTRATIGVLIL
jgi:hypothetical protein